ncbi:hypothetical protein D3C78_1229000 [compost metagenome]
MQRLAGQLRIVHRQADLKEVFEVRENRQAVAQRRLPGYQPQAIELRDQRQRQRFTAGIHHSLARPIFAQACIEKTQETLGIRTFVCRTHLKLVTEQAKGIVCVATMGADHPHLYIRHGDAGKTALWLPDQDRQVKIFVPELAQVLHRLGVAEFQLILGEHGDQTVDHPPVELRRQGGIECHSEGALSRRLERRDFLLQLPGGNQHLIHEGGQFRALARQRQALVRASEQPETELFLNLVQLRRQRLHREARMLGRCRQRAGLHDTHEVA